MEFEQKSNRPSDVTPAEFFEVEERIGYAFKNKGVLVQALTHSSAARDFNRDRGPRLQVQWNERLEFLGDAVLDLVISEILMARAPEADEGALSKMRAQVVQESSLVDVAMRWHLGGKLILGKGELRSGGQQKRSILADAVEALIGAVYLDGGLSAAAHVVRESFSQWFDIETLQSYSTDYKSLLQEMVQARYKETPIYQMVGQTGPAHNPEFEVEVLIHEKRMASAKSSSKKRASQLAAQRALEWMAAQGESP